MSKTKKILGMVLAIVMIANVFAVSAFAADDTTYTQAWSLADPVKVDDTHYTVDVSLTTNYATGGIQFQINNTDNTNVVLTGVTAGAAIPATYGTITPSYNNTSGKVMLVPDTAGQNSIAATAINGVIATLEFTLASSTASSSINIINNPKTEANVNGTLIAMRMSDGDLITGTPLVGQTVTGVGETKNIGAAAVNAELSLLTGVTINTGYCNTTYDGVIFGFGSFGSVANLRKGVTSTLGDDYISITPYNTNRYGTGSVINLLAADKTTVLKSYVVVIFGDVNGDGRVTTTDIEYLVANRTALASATTAFKLAANVNGDVRHSVTTADIEHLVLNRATFATAVKQQAVSATY